MTLYRIRHWQKFETHQTRILKDLRWVALPNDQANDGFLAIMEHTQGDCALYGAWVLILQLASKCQPRGTLLKRDGQPHTAESIAFATHGKRAQIQRALTFLSSTLNWLENLDVSGDELAEIRRLSGDLAPDERGSDTRQSGDEAQFLPRRNEPEPNQNRTEPKGIKNYEPKPEPESRRAARASEPAAAYAVPSPPVTAGALKQKASVGNCSVLVGKRSPLAVTLEMLDQYTFGLTAEQDRELWKALQVYMRSPDAPLFRALAAAKYLHEGHAKPENPIGYVIKAAQQDNTPDHAVKASKQEFLTKLETE